VSFLQGWPVAIWGKIQAKPQSSRGACSNYFGPIRKLYFGEMGVQLLYTEMPIFQQIYY